MNVKSSLVVEEAEGIGISRRYLKPPDKMDPSANCQEHKQKGKYNFLENIHCAGDPWIVRRQPCGLQGHLAAGTEPHIPHCLCL